MRDRRYLLAVIVAVVVITAAACGSSKKHGVSQGTGPKATDAPSTELGSGVTATEINVGVLMLDFDCVKQFVDELRPDQKQAFQIFIDDINNTGGINNRKIVPVYKSFCPINLSSELAACTSLTEDNKVFAVIGIFYDPSGDAQLCFAKRHHTVIVANALTQGLIDKGPKGLMVTPDIIPERRLNVIMSLLKSERTLQGKKVGTISNAANRSRVSKVVVPGLRDLGVERGADATLTITGADTTEAQAQLDSFIERWKSDGTNALIIVGEDVAARQFVDKIKSAIPNMLLVADTTSILMNGRDEQKAHISPNPYDGAITAEGQTGLEHTKTPHFAFCRDIWEKATGRKVPSPNVVVKLPNGKQDDIYSEVEDACLFTNMFATIAKRVGPSLNNDNWVRTVNTFGPIDVNSTIYASLHEGKYDADDTYGLKAYDSTIPDIGDWREVTPVQNVGT